MYKYAHYIFLIHFIKRVIKNNILTSFNNHKRVERYRVEYKQWYERYENDNIDCH